MQKLAEREDAAPNIFEAESLFRLQSKLELHIIHNQMIPPVVTPVARFEQYLGWQE